MIARLPNKNQKSVSVIQRVLNIGDYARVIVIDDLFEGRGSVWSKSLPSQLPRGAVQFIGFNIPPFMEEYALFSSSANLLPLQIMRRCVRFRKNDSELWRVNNIVQFPDGGGDQTYKMDR